MEDTREPIFIHPNMKEGCELTYEDLQAIDKLVREKTPDIVEKLNEIDNNKGS